MHNQHTTLGSVIKNARKRSDLTIEELADRLKISERYLYRIENEGKKPTAEQVCDLRKSIEHHDHDKTLQTNRRIALYKRFRAVVPALCCKRRKRYGRNNRVDDYFKQATNEDKIYYPASAK